MVKVPERILWTLDLLDVQPDDQILEFGFGPGVSVELICERLDGGQILGLDRSATAVNRARQRLAAHVAAGRAALKQVDLAGFAGPSGRFDKAFGVNVNAFWTGPADAELTTIARTLRPEGVVLLVYEGPPGGSISKVVPDVTKNMERHGFVPKVVEGPTSNLICIQSRVGQG